MESPDEFDGSILGTEENGTTRQKHKGIVTAISQIQQFAVIERGGQEIAEDFLTIQGKLNFFNVGLRSGFLEGIIFGILSIIIIPILADPATKAWVTYFFPLAQYDGILRAINSVPIVIIGGICCVLSRYRIGTITKKSVDSLLFGRVISLIIKGVLLFAVYLFIAKLIDVRSSITVASIFGKTIHIFAVPLADIFGRMCRYITFFTSIARELQSLANASLAPYFYTMFLNVKPQLVRSAYMSLVIFGIAAIIPFMTVWAVAVTRKHKKEEIEKFWED